MSASCPCSICTLREALDAAQVQSDRYEAALEQIAYGATFHRSKRRPLDGQTCREIAARALRYRAAPFHPDRLETVAPSAPDDRSDRDA